MAPAGWILLFTASDLHCTNASTLTPCCLPPPRPPPPPFNCNSPRRWKFTLLLCCLQYRSLLPTTRNAHYRVSPSPDELLRILAGNQGHPLPVENFTVEHKELGKIHWLVPVLPWKLDLDKVINIGHLVVEVSQLSGRCGQGCLMQQLGKLQ